MHQYDLRLFAGAALFALATALSTAAQAAPVTQAELCTPKFGGDNPVLTPYLRTERNVAIRTPGLAEGFHSASFKTLQQGQGYTRLVLHYLPCTGALRNNDGQQRDWVKRLFAGKAISKLLTVRASLPSPSIATVNPIATIGHDSSRKTGEVFSTEVSNQLWLTPYFRLNGPTNVGLDFSLNAATEYKTSVAGDALELIKRASGLIAPSSSLVTDVNKDRFNDAASFVDTSINSFLKQSVLERRKDDYPVVAGETNLVAVALSLPAINNTLRDAATVGVWVVSTDRIIASVFAPGASGSRLRNDELSAASILNFEVANGVTLRESLASRPQLNQARDRFLHAESESSTNMDENWNAAARGLCTAIESEAQAIGLVPMDVGAVLWAYADTLPLEEKHRNSYFRACGENRFYPEGDARVAEAGA